jgi:D-alanine-D-alanine ligase
MKESVLVLYNMPCAAQGADTKLCAESEAGILNEVAAVTNALELLEIKYRSIGLESFADISKVLAQSPERIVFNLVEGFPGDLEDVNYVPAVCRAFGKSVTGNETHALALSLDKWHSKMVLASHGLPVPAGIIVKVGEKAKASLLPPGPYIVKPISTDASEGIDFHSIVQKSGAALNKVVAQVHEQFGQPALVEQFIGGRELNVSVLQIGDETRVLPLAEIDFSKFDKDKPRIVGYSAKWLPDSFEFNNTPRIIPAPLPQRTAARVREGALDAWHAVGCQDYARIDFRLDEKLNPYVLEVNPNPDISPDAGFAAALEAAGIEYSDFVKAMINNAAARLRLPVLTQISKPKTRRSQPRIVRCTAEHREDVQDFIKATKFFRPDEVDVAMEVLDEAIAKGPIGHYQ